MNKGKSSEVVLFNSSYLKPAFTFFDMLVEEVYICSSFDLLFVKSVIVEIYYENLLEMTIHDNGAGILYPELHRRIHLQWVFTV